MNSSVKHEKKMALDTIIYLIAKVFEGALGIITLAYYTRLFPVEVFGSYGILNTYIVTVATFCTLWLSQSIYRYYSKYESDEQLEGFYSTAFFSWLGVSSLLLVILVFGTVLISNFGSQPKDVNLLMVCSIAIITNGTMQVLTAILAARRNTIFNLIISVTTTIFKFVFAVILIKIMSVSIIWIFVAYIISDIIISVIICNKLKIFKRIEYNSFSKVIFREFTFYGLPLLGSFLTATLLNTSDRFVIYYFFGDAKVAFYYGNYAIMSSAFTMINFAFTRGSYPTILKLWSDDKKDMAESLVVQTVKYYLIFAVPAVIGIFVLHEELAFILHSDYKESSIIMFWVALALVFNFLTEFSNKPWELTSQTKYIFRNSLVAGIVNVTLNLLFLRRFGYKFAGVTTFIGFFVYFILSKKQTAKYIKWNLPLSYFGRLFFSSGIMGICVYYINNLFNGSIVGLGLSICCGVIIYFLCGYATGLFKNEILLIFNTIKNKLK